MYLLNIFNSSGLRQGEAGCVGSLTCTRILGFGFHLFVIAMFSLGAMNAGGATGNTNWSVDVSTNRPPARWHFQHCYKHVFAVKAEYDFECSGGGDHVGRLNIRSGQYYCMKCGMHMPQSMYELIVQNEWAHGGGVTCNCEDHAPTAPDRASPSPQRDKAPLPLPRVQPLRRKPPAPARRSSLQLRANPLVQSRQSLRMMRHPVLAMISGR